MYWKGRSWTAAILWGVFGSVKLYPLLLLAIFLSKKEYRQFFSSVFMAALTTVASLIYSGPDFGTAARGIMFGLGSFVKMFSTEYFEETLPVDHSIFAFLKVSLRSFRPDLVSLLHLYFVVFGLGMLALYFFRIRKLPVANQLVILTICMITLPPTSFNYTLLQLYAPFLIMVLLAVDHEARELVTPGFTAVFCLFALLFTPSNFLFYQGHGFDGQIKCVLLVSLFGVTLACPFEEPERSEEVVPELAPQAA